MFKISVKDPQVTERSGEKNGRKWHMRSQTAWAVLPGKPFPVEVTITLGDNQGSFQVGEYVLGAESAWVTKYGELRLDMTKLKAAAIGQPQAARAL